MTWNYHSHCKNINARMVSAWMLLVLVSVCGIIGCTQIFRVSTSIPVEEYLEGVAIDPRDDVNSVRILPVGIRLEGAQYLVVDLLVDGPNQMALRAADYLSMAAALKPDEWLEVSDPKGRKVGLTAREMLPGAYGTTASYSVRVDRSTARVLAQIRFRKNAWRSFPAGMYRVRIIDNPGLTIAVGGSFFSVDTRWHEFDIFSGTISPSAAESRPESFVPPNFPSN